MKVELRPTTQADIDHFIGRQFPYRARAKTAVLGDKILGIGGFAYVSDDTALVFLHIADGAQKYAMTLHKAALQTIEEAAQRGIRKIVAQADMTYPTAERWLRRLGFEPVEIDGETIWVHLR